MTSRWSSSTSWRWGGEYADAHEFRMFAADRSCGAWAQMDAVETGCGTLHTIRRPRHGDVSFLYIWLK
jgi:hypothetical protein